MINRAKEDGDLETLEEIAADPEAYARSQGLGNLDLSDRDEAESLRSLWESLQVETIHVFEAIDSLKQSPDYELSILSEEEDSYFERIVEKQQKELQREIDELSVESDKLGQEIENLTGETPFE